MNETETTETEQPTETTETEQPTEEPQPDQESQEPTKEDQPSPPVEAPSTEPPRDIHPNEIRGPIEEQFNAEREQLVQQHMEAREALEAQHRQNMADNARAKREALEGAGMTRSGRVPSEHSARLQQ